MCDLKKPEPTDKRRTKSTKLTKERLKLRHTSASAAEHLINSWICK